MTLRLTAEEAQALREATRREHRSRQAVAREAIAVYVSGRTQPRDEHLAHIASEDAELLRRLGGM